MAWSDTAHFEGEDAIITIEEAGESTVTNFETKITNIEVGGGASNTEDIFLFGGATINYQKPSEKFTVKFEFITKDTRFTELRFGSTGGVGAEIRSSDNPKKCRIILWFQASADIQKSGTIRVPSKSKGCRRMIFCNCKSVEVTTEFAADEVIRGNISFEFSSTDANAYANFFDEYTSDTTAALTTLTTTAHKGTLTWNATTPAWTGAYTG